MGSLDLNRRDFLAAAGAWSVLAGISPRPAAAGPPRVTNPRATSGDSVHEPDWQQRLTISVGPKQADLVGNGDRVVQAAVDYIARLGGGTVRIMPGVFHFRNAVSLRSGVRLVGSGEETVLQKAASATARLADDSDWYDQEVTVADARGFELGDGVCLRARNPHTGASDVIKRTLVARSGDRFKLDRALRKNFWMEGEATISTLFPILTSEHTADVVIENLTLDGNRENNEHLDGNYAGCIFLQDCNRYTIRNVTARNFNGDGVSWQICHDVVVENCHSHGNADLGLHPGSGSQRPVIRGNRLEGNKIGLFFCWGVKFGLAENNRISDSGDYGISIGHCDTDNLIRDNDVSHSGKVGVLFRDDSRGNDFWPHRNVVENNRIIDSGSESGIAVDIQGKTSDVTIANCEIRETRGPMQRVGVRIHKQAGNVTLRKNTFYGFSADVVDERDSS